MSKGVFPATLQKKCTRWAKVLRLGDWDITCRFATRTDMARPAVECDFEEPCFDDETTGRLHHCCIPEKVALILILPTYYNHDGHEISWNIDTLIIHELFHIIEAKGKQLAHLSKRAITTKAFEAFEEFNCDTVAAVLYRIYYNRF